MFGVTVIMSNEAAELDLYEEYQYQNQNQDHSFIDPSSCCCFCIQRTVIKGSGKSSCTVSPRSAGNEFGLDSNCAICTPRAPMLMPRESNLKSVPSFELAKMTHMYMSEKIKWDINQ